MGATPWARQFFGGMIMTTILNFIFYSVLYLLIEGFVSRRSKPKAA